VSARPAVTRFCWVTAGCSRVAAAGSWAAVVAGLYGLMVMVTVPVTVLSCESCTCMGKV
jgi:hypothetical protein